MIKSHRRQRSTRIRDTRRTRATARRTRPHISVDLRDGGRARLRPLSYGELEPQLAVFEAMSAESRLSRFLAPMPKLPSRMADVLAAVDGRDHVAWLATMLDRPIGMARYVRTGPETAEVALEVADAHQGRGIGAALLDAVTTVACASGIRRVEATVLPANEPSCRLMGRIGVQLAPAGTLLEGDGPLRLLTPPRVDRSAVLSLAAGTCVADSPDGSCTSA